MIEVGVYKRSKNPQVEELTKSYTDRSIAVSVIECMTREDGTKGCVWCGEPLKTKHPAQRYCKDKWCSKNMYAWGYPQKEEGLFFLLVRQDFKCNLCQYDYRPYIEQNILNKYYGTHFSKGGTYDTEYNFAVMKRLKNGIDPTRKPEVDHIVPIYKGGQSLGLDNHQAICFTCHKVKTSKDLSGKRK